MVAHPQLYDAVHALRRYGAIKVPYEGLAAEVAAMARRAGFQAWVKPTKAGWWIVRARKVRRWEVWTRWPATE